jgi:hypothetical protein
MRPVQQRGAPAAWLYDRDLDRDEQASFAF